MQRKTISVKNVDLTAAPGTTVIFTPFRGQKFVPDIMIVSAKEISGTISTAPQFKITDGTNDIVPADDFFPITQGNVSLTRVEPDYVATKEAPLKLVTTVAAAGTIPVAKADIYIEGVLIPE